ncbi:MAG: hypothetical protein H0X24_03415 [Ktedonobacterales bacterium]|nr:hypothetical protein [Ktedonobacterales bacterium]
MENQQDRVGPQIATWMTGSHAVQVSANFVSWLPPVPVIEHDALRRQGWESTTAQMVLLRLGYRPVKGMYRLLVRAFLGDGVVLWRDGAGRLSCWAHKSTVWFGDRYPLILGYPPSEQPDTDDQLPPPAYGTLAYSYRHKAPHLITLNRLAEKEQPLQQQLPQVIERVRQVRQLHFPVLEQEWWDRWHHAQRQLLVAYTRADGKLRADEIVTEGAPLSPDVRQQQRTDRPPLWQRSDGCA